MYNVVYSVSDALRALTDQEAGIWINGNYCDVINWVVDPLDWRQLPHLVEAYRVDDVREVLPITVHVHRDACYGDHFDIVGGTIGEDGRVDILALFGIHYAGREVCIDDAAPTGGTVYIFASGEVLIAVDEWN